MRTCNLPKLKTLRSQVMRTCNLSKSKVCLPNRFTDLFVISEVAGFFLVVSFTT